MIGNKVCTAIPYKTFKEKISLTKKYKDKHIEVYKNYILVIYQEELKMNKCPRCESEILKEEYNYCPICGTLLDYEVKDATVEVLKSMMANYIELECKDSEDEKGRKLAIGTLGIAITELERIAQEVEQGNLWNV